METKYEVIPLFPTPLYFNEIPEQLVLDHISLLNNEKIEKRNAKDFGDVSVNTYILNQDSYKNLSSYILQQVYNYAQNFNSYNYKNFKFSQSWISVKHPNESHLPHTHSNSLISGILFFEDLPPNTPSVNFYKEDLSFLSSHPIKPTDQLNQFTYTSYNVSYKKNLLLLFPSFLKHGVEENLTSSPRKSLAFNIVPTEGFGSEKGLNQLKFN